MQILGLVWLGTRTQHLAEMAAFAEDVLGLVAEENGDGQRFYVLPDGSGFELFGPEHEADWHPEDAAVGGFLVADVAEAQRELAAAGIDVSALRSGRVHTWAYFRAPDGCVYEIVSERPDDDNG